MAKDTTKLKSLYDLMRGTYGRTDRPEIWQAWRTYLLDLPLWAVSSAVLRAPELWPGDKMPVVGQIASEARRVIRSRRSQGPEEEPREQPSPMPEPVNIPTAYADLARRFEEESKANGWDPDRPSPHGVGARRLNELSKLMGLKLPIRG